MAAWFDGAMPTARLPDDPRVLDGLVLLGSAIRRARHELGLSQDRLEQLSGIDQSTISRLERGLAPKTPVHRLVSLGIVLRSSLALGFCPHDHPCAWQPTEPPDQRWPIDHGHPFLESASAWIDLDAMP